MMNKKRLSRISWGSCILPLISVASIATALYIMFHGLGLIDSLDFGAGAYYYADIPGFETFLRDTVYQSSVGFGVIFVLFLIWGWLMFRFWLWADKHF